MKKVLFILLLTAVFIRVQAITINSSGVGGNWSNPLTWIGGVVPAATDQVSIQGGHTVVLDVNASVAILTFNATYPNLGTLLINDPANPKILTTTSMNLASNYANGKIIVSGAAHEVHTTNIYLNFLASQSATMVAMIDMPVGKFVIDKPAGGNAILTTSANGTIKAQRVEFGNGVLPTTVITTDFLLYPNGRAVVMNNAKVTGTNLAFGNDQTATLVIKNGGTYSGSLYSPLNLGENDNDIVTGTFLQNMDLTRQLTGVNFFIPNGTFGNLRFVETFESGNFPIVYKSCPKTVRVLGSGVRLARIVGNLEWSRDVFNPTTGGNQTHPDVYFEGGLNAADCANVTFDLAGPNTGVNIGRDAVIMFKSFYTGATAAQQPTLKVSGTARINHFVNIPEHSTSAFKSFLEIYNLDVTSTGDLRYGSGAVVAMPNGATAPEHHRISILGNLNIDGNMNLTNTHRNILYFNNQAAATYSGTGVLRVAKLLGRINGTAANATKITSTLNEIYLDPKDLFASWNPSNVTTTYPFSGDYSWFEATAGTLRVGNKGWPYSGTYTDKRRVETGIGATQRISLFNLKVEDSTELVISPTFGNSATNFMKINGNIDMLTAESKMTHAASTLATNVLEFNGAAKQFINGFEGSSIKLNRIKINNANGVESKEDLILTMQNSPSVNAPQLQLVVGVLKMGANADKEIWVDNIHATFTTGISSCINDGALPINVNDYTDSWVHGKIKMLVKAYSSTHNGATGPNIFEYPVGTATHSQVARVSTGASADYWLTALFKNTPTTQPNPATCFVNQNSTGPNYGAMQSLINGGYWTITPHVPITAADQHSIILIARGYTNGGAPWAGTSYGLVNRTSSATPWGGAGNTPANTPQNTGTHLDGDQIEQAGVIIFTRRNNITFYGDFAAASKIFSVPLQLKWISFEATKTEKGAQLNWVTSSEENCVFYEIEKSKDAANWITLGTVKARGEFGIEGNYEFIDQASTQGINYYRIKQYNLDEKYTYSETRNITHQGFEQFFTIHPNPCTMNLNINIPTSANVKIEVYSMDGKLQLSTTTHEQNYMLNVSTLAQGLYVLRLQTPTQTSQQTFMKR